MTHAFSGETPWRRVRTTIPVDAPAAGADWSQKVPAGKLWRLLSIQATLTTAVAAGNRTPSLVLADGQQTFLTIPPGAVIAPSKVGTYAWIEHGSTYQLTDAQAIALPELVMMPGWSVGSSTDSLDAADAWTGIYLHVIETTIRDGSVDITLLPEVLVQVIAG